MKKKYRIEYIDEFTAGDLFMVYSVEKPFKRSWFSWIKDAERYIKITDEKKI